MMDLIRRVADVMRRCDPEYCESHSLAPTTDEEWDELLAEVEDAYDPTPYCSYGHMTRESCDCGPIAEND